MSLLWPDYITPDLRLSDADRRNIRIDALAQVQESHRWKSFVGVMLLLVVGTTWILIYFEVSGPWQTFSIVCINAVGLTAFAMFRRHAIGRFYRIAVRHKGYNVCIGCGYWLRGLDGPQARCPECGRHSEPVEPLNTGAKTGR